MDTNNTSASNGPLIPGWQRAIVLLKKLVIWALFIALIYLVRDFFFLGFMTFLITYMVLSLVDGLMERFHTVKRRLITVGIFVCLPLLLIGVGIVVMPHLITQGQHIIGWASRVNPEEEAARMLEGVVSHSEFEQQYGSPQDARYQKGLEEFQKTGERYVKQYLDFPSLDAWVEGSFAKQFADAERSKVRAALLSEGITSKTFEQWFLLIKYPELKNRVPSAPDLKGISASAEDALIRFAKTDSAKEALHQAQHDSSLRHGLQEEWIKDTVERRLATAKAGPAYREEFQKYFENRRLQKPELVPYTFDQFIALQTARAQGKPAFSEAMEKVRREPAPYPKAQLQADFEAAKKHELFQNWWNTSSPAKFIRHEIESNTTGNATGHMEGMLTALLNVPLDLSTALLLSFLICIDYPAMKRASQRLRETWLRDVYDEIVPALASLARLVGTAMYAQGLIAICNAALIFCGLLFFGVDHAALLSVAVFILCLVPTLGTIIAWVLIVIVALVQPGGGIILAAKATGVVVAVIILETFVFSPRILGRLMELHPVLIIIILPVAHSFFGIWGLLLAIPVTVYVINTIILGRDTGEHEPETTGISQTI